MAMDPFTALGLAGNILQFVDFSCELISKSREIYNSGVNTHFVDLQIVAANLSELSASCSSNRFNLEFEEEDALNITATACKEVADELLLTIEKLILKNGMHNKWSSFRQALKAIWKKDKIDALEHRLDTLRSQLNLDIVTILK
jgi:hypothetical protein